MLFRFNSLIKRAIKKQQPSSKFMVAEIATPQRCHASRDERKAKEFTPTERFKQ
jgi:hypothetical protein